MKRLTMRNSDGSVSQPLNTTVEAVFYRLAEYEDLGKTPEELRQMLAKYNLATVTFVSCICDSDGVPVKNTGVEETLLYNQNAIETDEVYRVIHNGSWKFDPRLIEVSKKQLEYLKGGAENE